MDPVPASHVTSVEAFVHVPLTVHASEPKSMADAAEEILTLPVTEPVPDVLVRSPPLIVNTPCTVNVAAALASVPPLLVNPSHVRAPAPEIVMVPADHVAAPPSMAPVEIEIVPAACCHVPVLVNVNVAIVSVLAHAPPQSASGAPAPLQKTIVPVVTLKLASIVPLTAPEPLSNTRSSPATGRPLPAPLLVVDQHCISVATAVAVQATSSKTAKRFTALALPKSHSNEKNDFNAPIRLNLGPVISFDTFTDCEMSCSVPTMLSVG